MRKYGDKIWTDGITDQPHTQEMVSSAVHLSLHQVTIKCDLALSLCAVGSNHMIVAVLCGHIIHKSLAFLTPATPPNIQQSL